MSGRHPSTRRATAKPALSLAEGIESWHKTIKRECIRPKTPLNLADARRVVTGYVQHYNEVRLHAGIGYVAPKDRLDGRDEAIRQNRRRKLAEARITRRAAHHTQTGAPSTPLQRSVAAPALP